jgi:hypothetical protein
MSKLHLRYLIMAVIVTTVTAIAFQQFIGTILIPEKQAGLTGAAFIAGWWGNLAAAFVIAIMAGRKAAQDFIDPRLGKVAGTGVGLWVGLGAIAGNVLAAVIFASNSNAALRPGLVLVFSLISLGIALITATISGRETAQPPQEDEA